MKSDPHTFVFDPAKLSTKEIQMLMIPMPGSITVTAFAYCPDLLRYEQIGAADTLRGKVVRAFFWLMRYWPYGR